MTCVQLKSVLSGLKPRKSALSAVDGDGDGDGADEGAAPVALLLPSDAKKVRTCAWRRCTQAVRMETEHARSALDLVSESIAVFAACGLPQSCAVVITVLAMAQAMR